jgi:NDP-sugar pyrophosphorylase family protein
MTAPSRAAVLAGGLGTRLRPYTTILPKPLVPVGDRPILELLFDWLARGGVERVDVCIGHLGELIQTYFSQARTIPPRLDVSWRREPEALGTAGALRSVPDVEETLLVVNGDIVTDLNLSEMLAFHRSRGAALTIATRVSEVETDLGVIEHDHGLVVNYQEKPVLSYTASMGIYLYEPQVLRSLPEGPLQFPDLVLALLARGEPVAAFQNQAAWQHIGTLTQHQEAHRRLEDQPLP